MEVTIIEEFGVVHLQNALTLKEQVSLFQEVKGNMRGVGNYPGIFHASSGSPEAEHRNDMLHEFGELLFNRCAEAVVASSLTAEEIAAEPALKRLGEVASGGKPPVVNYVTGASYKPGATMTNHSDLDRPLYTMSVAVGNSCDFAVGKRTARPKKNERSGTPVTIKIKSGDVIYFDGGSVPHEVSQIDLNTAPAFYKKCEFKDVARISVLFREPS